MTLLPGSLLRVKAEVGQKPPVNETERTYLVINGEYKRRIDELIILGAMLVKFVRKREFFMRYMDDVAKSEYVGFTSDAENILRGLPPIHPTKL